MTDRPTDAERVTETPLLVEPGALTVLPGNRTPAGRFPKGLSGNPRGRPKGSAGLAAYIRQRTREGRDLADTVIDVLTSSEDAKVKIDAATWLANRAFGTPVQSHEVTGVDGGPLTFTLRLGERDADGG